MRALLTLVACFGLGWSPASAEPAYKAEDIVKNFAPTRGICIGTETECGGGGTDDRVAAPPPSFNLLVTFDLDAAELTDEAKENLDQFAIALKNPLLAESSFEVEGHTDARGSEAYNLTLSERRAAAVTAYLQSKGVETSRLKVRGFGMSRPRTPDPLDGENRRVEARLVQ